MNLGYMCCPFNQLYRYNICIRTQDYEFDGLHVLSIHSPFQLHWNKLPSLRAHIVINQAAVHHCA